MGARQTNRSPRGAQAEAKRRLADSIARAETALADFLEASEQIDYARQLIASYEVHQQRALGVLVDAVGREQAAELTGVDERQIRAALAQARSNEPQSADVADAHEETGEHDEHDEHDEAEQSPSRDTQPNPPLPAPAPDTNAVSKQPEAQAS